MYGQDGTVITKDMEMAKTSSNHKVLKKQHGACAQAAQATCTEDSIEQELPPFRTYKEEETDAIEDMLWRAQQAGLCGPALSRLRDEVWRMGLWRVNLQPGDTAKVEPLYPARVWGRELNLVCRPPPWARG